MNRASLDESDQPLLDDKEVGAFYMVYSMRGESSPDVARYQLEDELHTLSFEFRDHPTLPSDPLDPKHAMSGALDKSKALFLLSKHCAFRYCSWCGHDDDGLVQHLLGNHIKELGPAMEKFAHLRFVAPREKQVLVLSVYNEGLAIAIRRGAPLASYSIDRKCLREYTQHATDSNTQAAVCHLCSAVRQCEWSWQVSSN